MKALPMETIEQATSPATALCRCYVCGGNISKNAFACPHCGEPYKPMPAPPSAKDIAVAVCIGLVITSVVMGFVYHVVAHCMTTSL